MTSYIENSFINFDEEFKITPRKFMIESRKELSERLIRLSFHPEDIDRIFPTVYLYSKGAYELNSARESKEWVSKIKALKQANRALDNVMSSFLIPLEEEWLPEIKIKMQKLVDLNASHFEFLNGRKSDKNSPSTFKKGRKKHFDKDLHIYHLVMFFERVLKYKKTNPKKGDSSRNLALLMLNSAGFDDQSTKGQISAKIVKDSFKRGKKNLELMYLKLDQITDTKS